MHDNPNNSIIIAELFDFGILKTTIVIHIIYSYEYVHSGIIA